MSIPLVQKPDKDDINTSIIAIKRNIERINMLLGLVDSGNDPDLSGLATKQELQDAITELSPVDEVTIDNMQSVTSNAVFNKTKMYVETVTSEINDATSTNPWTAPHNGIVFVRATVTATNTNNKVYYVRDKTLNYEYGNYNSQPAQTFSFAFPIIKGNEYYRGSSQNINNVQIRVLYIGD